MIIIAIAFGRSVMQASHNNMTRAPHNNNSRYYTRTRPHRTAYIRPHGRMAIRKKESTGEVQSKIKFLQVVHFAKTSELVDDDFLDRLEREGLSPSINEELVSVFLQVDEEQSGWFNRFASLLKKHPKYRSSSVQLQDVDGKTPRVFIILMPNC